MAKPTNLHEDYHRKDDIKVGGEKSFGIVFAVVFTIIGLWPLWGASAPRWWALIVAGIFLVAGFVAPKLLRPLNLLWFRFGMLLHKIVNPLVMGLVFFVTVTPTGLIFRLLGKDPLRLKLEPDAESYWIKRDPPGPDGPSMSNQF